MNPAMPSAPDACHIDPAPQRETIAFLAERAFGRSRRIDTHAACVFLAGDRAWKLKKAVDLGYLDFSTSDKRRRALEAELRLNRHTAPELYLDLHPITRDPKGQLAISGTGETVDWLLEMHRFPDGALLDELASHGQLELPLMLALADAVAAFHTSAPAVDGWDSAGALSRVIDGNAAQLEQLAEHLPATTCGTLVALQREALGIHQPLLACRASAGRVRRVHGDLHLRNVALIDGKPVPFDCLEFDEALATTDVLYDLAFLLMDLWHRGLRDQANAVFNRYLDLSAADEAGTPLLPLFLSIRATVRAHVEATAAEQGQPGAAEAARSYLDLAVEAMQPQASRLIAVGGLSGTGKTTVARALGGRIGRAPGARILRSDVLRKRDMGLRPEDRLPRSSYTPAAADRTYDLLRELASRHLSAGETVIADAAFQDQRQREALVAVARGAGSGFNGVWLVADRQTRIERVRSRQGDASDADERVARAQSETMPAPGEPWTLIRAGGDEKGCVENALGALGLARP